MWIEKSCEPEKLASSCYSSLCLAFLIAMIFASLHATAFNSDRLIVIKGKI